MISKETFDFFETPLFNQRHWIIIESPGYSDSNKNYALIYHRNNIHRFERYANDPHHIARNEERWEILRELFFGDEIPKGWHQ